MANAGGSRAAWARGVLFWLFDGRRVAKPSIADY